MPCLAARVCLVANRPYSRCYGYCLFQSYRFALLRTALDATNPAAHAHRQAFKAANCQKKVVPVSLGTIENNGNELIDHATRHKGAGLTAGTASSAAQLNHSKRRSTKSATAPTSTGTPSFLTVDMLGEWTSYRMGRAYSVGFGGRCSAHSMLRIAGLTAISAPDLRAADHSPEIGSILSGHAQSTQSRDQNTSRHTT